MKKYLLFLVLFSHSVFAEFPSSKSIVLLGDKISEYRHKKNDELRYKDVKVLEYLLYKGDHFRAQLNKEKEFKKRFGAGVHLLADLQEKTITYKFRSKTVIKINESNASVTYDVLQKGVSIDKGSIPLASIDEEFVKDLKTDLYRLTLESRGMSDLQIAENIALNIKHDQMIEDQKETFTLRIKEGLFNSESDNTNWEYLPVKLVSYPIQKIFYDIPNIATSTVVESVTRSPLHNIQGAGDEFKGAGLGIWNGLKDLVRGIFKPKHATFFDGALGIGDASLRVVKGGLGVVKSAVSIVGYPLYRVFGGKKSKRTPLRGKRATIVIIDTGIDGGIVDGIVDTYGETIVRGQLKSLGQYYCVESNAEPNSILDCIDRMPSNIQYVDLFALTHTGGTRNLEQYAQYAAKKRGVKPELMVSIGCYDDPSNMTEKENTVGQNKTSWAVHYYLSNLISKRLRGIPMAEAANEAFIEGMPTNIINPISLGAYGAISAMEGDISLGYFGSKPDLHTDYKIAQNLIVSAWGQLNAKMNDYKWDYLLSVSRDKSSSQKSVVDRTKLEEALISISKVNAYLSERESDLPKKAQELLQNSMLLLSQVNTQMNMDRSADESYYQMILTLSSDKKMSRDLGVDLSIATILARN